MIQSPGMNGPTMLPAETRNLSANTLRVTQKSIFYYKFVQFVFFSQWQQVYDYARTKNISLIGDIPIYVALDSADVWANQELFQD